MDDDKGKKKTVRDAIDKAFDEVTSKIDVRLIGIDMAEFKNEKFEEVIERLKDNLQMIFDATHPPESYWRAFADHYELDDMGEITKRFSAFCFFNGMRSCMDIVKSVRTIPKKEVHALAFGMINGMVADLVKRSDPENLMEKRPD